MQNNVDRLEKITQARYGYSYNFLRTLAEKYGYYYSDLLFKVERAAKAGCTK